MKDGLPGVAYHKEDLLVYTQANRQRDLPFATCEKQSMALVGLHVPRKTVKQPSWTWATWEHRRNAPDCAGLPPDGRTGSGPPGGVNANCPLSVAADYNFARADCSNGACQSCNTSPLSNALPGQCEDSYLPDTTGWCPNAPPAAEKGYSYLCRQVPVEANYPSAALWNRRCSTALGESSVWSQYELIATQWTEFEVEPTKCENVQADFNPSCEGKSSECLGPKLNSRESLRPQVAIPADNDEVDVDTRPWLSNTSMESYERSNGAGCHAKGEKSANQDALKVSTDFMYFVQFETCAAWCGLAELEICPCLLPRE